MSRIDSPDQPYTPHVKEGHAFREISRDFTTPAEIFREAIANSLDAYAQMIWLRVTVELRRGRETVVIDLVDDGLGMNAESVKAFLNLSDSQKPTTGPDGMPARRMTGYKGHGTKIYLNSERVEILSYDGRGQPIYCIIDDPRGHLAEGTPPPAVIREVSLEDLRTRREQWGFADLALKTGTAVRVAGYHNNSKKGLEHTLLSDYIRWFTRWGSWEPKLRHVTKSTSQEVDDFSKCRLFLRGLGKEPQPAIDEPIAFGHVFPASDVTDIRQLRGFDDIDPLKFYVRTWAFENEPLEHNPEKRIDFLFAIEGEGARRQYNDMLRRQGKPRRPGDYLSEERYGLWLCRDYVPIQRFNQWVSEKSEYTRMHAFVNCDALNLTGNRGSVENTPQELLDDVEKTVRTIFAERIEKHDDYAKFEDEMLALERHRHATKEASDYKRRLKRLEAKQCVKINNIEFLSPSTETDLIALVAGVQAIIPDILPFTIRDYDSHFGFDALAARSRELDPTEVEHLFVEFKLDLKGEFNHTFEKLEAILCWGTRMKDQQEVTDLAGQKGTYRISATRDQKKKRYIVIPNSRRNVEVIVFRELLAEKGYRFRNGGD